MDRKLGPSSTVPSTALDEAVLPSLQTAIYPQLDVHYDYLMEQPTR